MLLVSYYGHLIIKKTSRKSTLVVINYLSKHTFIPHATQKFLAFFLSSTFSTPIKDDGLEINCYLLTSTYVAHPCQILKMNLAHPYNEWFMITQTPYDFW